jgi:methylated-DNA-protein-cysteine methyltransferase-like protein
MIELNKFELRRLIDTPMKSEEFYAKVYELVAEIPRGRVATYGQIAFMLGRPQCPRWVGQALRHAPADAQLPCHRVVNIQGRIAPCWAAQRDLLVKEGVIFKENGCVNLKKHLWQIFV